MGKKIRQFIRELFGSRLVERLEEDLLRTRQDFEARILEYQHIIADVRGEKAALQTKLAIFEISIQQKVGIDPSRTTPRKPSFANLEMPKMMTSWQLQVAEHEKLLAKEAAEEKASALGGVKA